MLTLEQEEILEFPILLEWTRDMKEASRILTPSEVRFLVDAYYTIQEHRISVKNQIRASEEGTEPNAVLDFLFSQVSMLEQKIKTALDVYTDSTPVGQWLKSVHGIGPVISAGLLAHIDITKAPYAGNIWSFAGLDPSAEWAKGQKRPWNARLKVLCWKAGESFVKFSGSDKCFYGKIYLQRKELETSNNDACKYSDQAASILASKKIGKETEAYKSYSIGKLPPAQIHARAKRYAVKIFLSHLHHVWYRSHYHADPPKPFAISILGHGDFIPPPI